MTREQIIQALEECAERKCQPTVASALDVIRELQEEVNTSKVMIDLLQRDIADRDAMLEKKVEEVHPEFMRDYRAMREELEGLYDDLADAHQQIKELHAEIKELRKGEETQ